MIVAWQSKWRRHQYYGLGYVNAWSAEIPFAGIDGFMTSITESKQPSCITTGRNLLSAADVARMQGGTTVGYPA